MFRRGAVSRTRDLGRVAIGFGLMLLALRGMLMVMAPYENTPSLHLVLGALASEPLIGLLIAAVLTGPPIPASPSCSWSCPWLRKASFP